MTMMVKHRKQGKPISIRYIILGCLCFLQAIQISANVIGIDLGSSFFKITLVKPGQPFAIVENFTSKRKTENSVTITDETRLFGYDSFTESSKYPKTTFSGIQQYLGQSYDKEFLKKLKEERMIMNDFAEDDRGLLGWKIVRKDPSGGESNEEVLYTEELVAIILKYGKQLAEIQAGNPIKDVVITIPSYFTPSQKRMMYDSAEMAGLYVQQLIHENTAVATMYGIDRMDKDKDHIVLLYNMGDLDTEVSLIKYSTINEPVTNKSFEHIEILSEAYVKNYGGSDFDNVLVNMIVGRFNALKERQGKPDLRENPRAMKRVLKESVKIKEILSANKQNQVKISELQDYVTLQTLIERKEFEDQAVSLLEKVMIPVTKVLKQAALSIDQVDQVELIGGGIRVPKI